MKNLLVILNLIVVLFAIKLRAEPEIHTETSNMEEERYSRKTYKNTGQAHPRSKHIDYYRELVNILGHQFEDVEVLSCQNNIDNMDNTNRQVIKTSDQKPFSMQKSKLYAVYPYQPKSDMSPAMHGLHGAMLYLDNDVPYSSLYYQPYARNVQLQHTYSSPNKPDMSPAMYGPHGAMLHLDNDLPYSSLYYQPYARYLQLQHAYVSPNKNVFFNLFPGLSSKSPVSSFTNQLMTTKEKKQKAKDNTSKITLERQSMAWPFGYDLTLSPVEYSLLHNIHVPHHPYMVEIGRRLDGREDKKRDHLDTLPSNTRVEF